MVGMRSLEVLDDQAHVALLLAAQDLGHAEQARRHEQLGAQRLQPLGQRRVAHLQARGAPNLVVEHAHVEAHLAQRRQF